MNDHGANVPVWQTFEIIASAGSSPVDHLECQLDNGPWQVCVSPWDPDLTGGPHQIGARAVDVNGLADPTPATATFNVDVDPPAVSVMLNEGASVTGRLVVHLGVGLDDQASVTDLLIANSPELDGNGRLAHGVDAWVTAPTTWHLDTAGGDASPGVHTVYVQASDVFGNWSSPASDSIQLDPSVASPVTIRLAVSENPAPVGGRIVLFGLAHADDGAAILDGNLQMWIDSTNLVGDAAGWTVENGTYIDASGLAAGTYVLNATYKDSADLSRADASLSFKVGPGLSPLGPKAYFADATPYPVFDDPKPFHLAVDSKFGSAETYACRIDEAAWAPCNGGLDVPVLATGWHIAEVRGTDGAGRVQAEPEAFWWLVNSLDGGAVYVSGGSGFTASSHVTLFVDSPGWAVALRISNSRSADGTGRLANGSSWEPPVGMGVPIDWDVTDADLGGIDADGYKFIWLQWQRSDGTWTIPTIQQVRLDRAAPRLALKVENGSAFVDENELLIVATTSEPTTVSLSDHPLDPGPGCPSPTNDGLDLRAWPVGDVPIGGVATRHIYAKACDAAGNWSEVEDATISIDRSSPTSTVPAVLFDVGSRVSPTDVDAWVTGSAKDTGSGVAKVSLQRRIGSTWTTLVTASSSSVSSLRTLPIASTRAFRERGTDRLGHVGSWATTASLRPILRGDSSSSISYSGTWKVVANSSALGNALHRTYSYGAKATLRFTGRAIGIVAPRGPGLGRLEVWIDGRKVSTVDLRRTSYHPRVLVFARSWTTAAAHAVTIRNLDTHGRQVQLDGFVVMP